MWKQLPSNDLLSFSDLVSARAAQSVFQMPVLRFAETSFRRTNADSEDEPKLTKTEQEELKSL